jgi:hypothetical protein
MWTNSKSVPRRQYLRNALILLVIVPVVASVFITPQAIARSAALGRVSVSTPSIGTSLARSNTMLSPASYLPTIPPNAISAPDTIGLWTPTGPVGSPPTVNSIVMDGPATQVGTQIVIATDSGVYLSTTGGSSWTDWSDGLLSQTATAVVRGASGTFYVLAGGLVYRRTPADAIWSNYSQSLPDGSIFKFLAISPDETLFTANDSTFVTLSMYRRGSADTGWSNFAAGLPSSGLKALVVGSSEVYAGFANNVLASPLTSATWISIKSEGTTPSPRDLPLASNPLNVLAVDPDGRLYAGLTPTSPPNNSGGVWRTTTCPPTASGRCWEAFNGTPNTGNYLGNSSITQLAITQAREVFAVSQQDINLKGTDDTPATRWSRSTDSSVGTLVPSPTASRTSGDNVVFFGSQNGILRSFDLGGNASLVNDGLELGSAIHSLSFTDNRTFFAASDKYAYRSNDNGAGWTAIYQQSFVYPIVSIEPSATYGQDGYVFLSEALERLRAQKALNSASNYQFLLATSVNQGTAWATTFPDLFADQRADVLLSSPSFQDDGTLFAAEFSTISPETSVGTSVLRSTDRGVSWSSIDTGLENRHLQALAIAPGSGDRPTLVAGTDTGIFTFDTQTVSWKDFNADQIIGSIRQIAYSPNYSSDQALFILGDSGLYRYHVNATPQWERLSATNLPLAEVQTLRISPAWASDTILFAQTSQDVWISRDSGSTWEPVSKLGLPELDILSLEVSPDFANDRAIFVGTNGKGIFKYILPPPAPPWLVLLYLGGQDHGGDQSLDESIKLLLDRLRALPTNPAVRIVALYDGNQADDSVIYVKDSQADGLRKATDLPPELAGKELDTGSVSTLKSFIRWARQTYAGSPYTMLSIVDHGGGWAPDFGLPGQHESEASIESGGWRGMSLDVSGPNDVTSLSTKETGQALRDLGDLGQFNIIFFDACLMGQIETAYEIRDYTDYFIAGENLLWSNLPYDKYFAETVMINGADKGLKPITTPEMLASNIVDLYDAFTPYDPSDAHNQAFAIAAVNMQKLIDLDLGGKTNMLAEQLFKPLPAGNIPPTNALRIAIQKAYEQAQKFDYDVNLAIDQLTDGYVDLAHFALLVSQEISALPDLSPDVTSAQKTAIIAAADAISNILTPMGANQIILNRRHQNADVPKQGTGPWKFDKAYGLSIYMPLGERDCRPSGQVGDPDDGLCTQTELEPSLTHPGIVRQLKYYINPNQLAFTKNARNWSILLNALDQNPIKCLPAQANSEMEGLACSTKLDSEYTRNLLTRPFNSPYMLRTEWRVFLPLLLDLGTRDAGTDLEVLNPVQVPPSAPQVGQPVEIKVTIKNRGTANITQPFWVDLYIDPSEKPRTNHLWPELDPDKIGVAWRVYGLGAGQTVTLSTLHPNDPLDPGHRYSSFTAFLSSGAHQLYVLVDSYAEGQDRGAVIEDNEQNNLSEPIAVTVRDGGVLTGSAAPHVVLDARPAR